MKGYIHVLQVMSVCFLYGIGRIAHVSYQEHLKEVNAIHMKLGAPIPPGNPGDRIDEVTLCHNMP